MTEEIVPKAPSPVAEADPAKPVDTEMDRKKPQGRFRNWLVDAGASTAVALVVAFIFEHLVGSEGVHGLSVIQRHFHDAVSSFDPWHVFSYIGDTIGFLDYIVSSIISKVLIVIFSPEAVPYIVNIISKVMFVLYLVTAFVLWPVAVVIEIIAGAHLLEGVLVLVCWLAIGHAITLASDPTDNAWPGFYLVLMVIGVVCFLWLVKLTMLLGDALFGWFVVTAQSCVGGSVMASTFYWCSVKVSEHSVTERLMHLATRSVSSGIHHTN